jgi:large subunit ribosomal protein L5
MPEKPAKKSAKKDAKAPSPAAEKPQAKSAVPSGPPRLLKRYREEVLPAMTKRFGYTNVMQAPKLVKITLNMGVGEGSRDVKVLEAAEADLALISGQKAKRVCARVSVANFKLRQGMPVGCVVTLRGRRMYEFLDRLINISIPRIRDFRGLAPDGFDGRGNHAFGIREHVIFVELDLNKVTQTRGMDICTTTTARTDEEARELLTLMGIPFRQ